MMSASDLTDLQVFIELVPSPVIVKNRDHRLIMVNNLACELFQRSREVLIARFAEDLFTPDEVQAFHEADDRVFSTGAIDESEEPLTDAYGNVRYLITRKQRINVNDIDYLIAVLTDVTAYREAEEHARNLSLHDPLTGLPNRILFWNRIEDAVLRSSGSNALMLIDLDNFKAINDNYGHATGDNLIIDFSDRLLALTRPTDTVARIGGDEFAILLTDISDNSVVGSICEQIIHEASDLPSLMGKDAHIGASIGVVPPGCGLVDQAEMLRRADVALYQAKRDGRGCWRAYTEEFDHALLNHRSESAATILAGE
ncbi:GGDEF domain-containing protein [Polymorphobacter sp. PAMC 29334]|uniref:sensor domain-containing diguanylate cyclase n=1 Tax=Polymorphobacter sp. PAMC 29334 TaxID=2862331 RepID=UPI001C676548|nr:sensor domain-containing diguanylate cyclase [Polymorphobacter sp. PAMC 29334]QYE33740.1 GGDEF domain-containing protein [Polymorphobacter sp. PAMC 29334]